MAYRLDFTAAAARELRKLPTSIQAWLTPHLSNLVIAPRPPGSKKLKGTDGYRLRVGDYRILYEIQEAASRVLIVKVAHRKEAYR